jgi:class 3 adenylate cyclase
MPSVSSIGPLSYQRRLAAILFTDIVGYTAMMQKDEMHAVRIIKRYAEVLNEHVSAHNGEVLNDYGDGTLCAFSSSVEAVQCAYDIQKDLQRQPSVPLRIGLHIGEIFFENGKVMGDGVNLASRIQSMGRENTILFSEEIHDKIKNVSRYDSRFVGSFEFKNVDKPINVYALGNEGLSVPRAESLEGKLKKPAGRVSWTDWIFGLNRK